MNDTLSRKTSLFRVFVLEMKAQPGQSSNEDCCRLGFICH